MREDMKRALDAALSSQEFMTQVRAAVLESPIVQAKDADLARLRSEAEGLRAEVKRWEDKEVSRAVNCCGQEDRALAAEAEVERWKGLVAAEAKRSLAAQQEVERLRGEREKVVEDAPRCRCDRAAGERCIVCAPIYPLPGSIEATKSERCRCGRGSWRDLSQFSDGPLVRCLGCDHLRDNCKCTPVDPPAPAAPPEQQEYQGISEVLAELRAAEAEVGRLTANCHTDLATLAKVRAERDAAEAEAEGLRAERDEARGAANTNRNQYVLAYDRLTAAESALASERARGEALRGALRECMIAIRRMDPAQEMVTDDSPLLDRARRVLDGEREK